MPSTCSFEFDRPDPVYYSGEVINGRITLHTTSEKSIRDAHIKFEGLAKVHWTEQKTRTENGKTTYYTEHYRGSETYVSSRTDVSGECTLPAGTHSYTFCIPLSLDCPTSCTEQYGKISYELSLVLNRKFHFDNVYTHALTVIRQVDLNLMPEMLIPLHNEDTKYFCCWPCTSDPVISTLVIPFGGYAPGQSIKFTLTIDNQSNYDLEGITLRLMQTYKFMARSPYHKTRYHENCLARTHEDDRYLRLTKRVINGTLVIPPVPPTSYGTGRIIEAKYHINMAIKTGSCHSDSDIVIPIVVGTVPLAQSATNPSHAIEPTAPLMPPSPDSLGGDKPPNYDTFVPPTYEQATNIGQRFVDPESDKFNSTDDFIPKYPMYSNFAEPSAPSAFEDEPLRSTEAPSQRPPYPLGPTGMPEPPTLRLD